MPPTNRYTSRLLLEQPRLLKYHVLREDAPLAYGDVVDLWQQDAPFREQFSDWLLASSFKAIRWETPPLTRSSLSRPFEFVLHDAPALIGRADASAFAEQLASPGEGGIASFENLSGDAKLVVPAAHQANADYGHLAAFLRNAPDAQKHALWQRVGLEMARRTPDRPVWLSTAGMGVPWLHVRLDVRPKYYGYAPYTNEK